MAIYQYGCRDLINFYLDVKFETSRDTSIAGYISNGWTLVVDSMRSDSIGHTNYLSDSQQFELKPTALSNSNPEFSGCGILFGLPKNCSEMVTICEGVDDGQYLPSIQAYPGLILEKSDRYSYPGAYNMRFGRLHTSDNISPDSKVIIGVKQYKTKLSMGFNRCSLGLPGHRNTTRTFYITLLVK